MKVFFDCEFTGLHQKTTLLSLGCVSEDGKQFYAEFDDADNSQIDEWLMANVVAHLWSQSPEIMSPPYVTHLIDNSPEIAVALAQWLAQFGEVEMWGDCLAYDWVLFCNLWGGARDMPPSVYYIPFDLSTLFKIKGIDPDINREEFAGIIHNGNAAKHNALWDAQVIMSCYLKAMTL